MNRIIPTLTTILLAGALTACGGGSDEPAASSPVAPPATQTAPQRTTEPLELGKEFTITHCNGDKPCEVKVKFDSIKRSKTCPTGANSTSLQTTGAEKTYLTISGEYEVVTAATNYSIDVTDFKAATSDHVAKEPDIARDCSPTDTQSDLSNPVGPGLKRVGTLMMAIDPDVSTLRFSPVWEPVTREIDLAQFPVDEGAGEQPAVASTTSAPIASTSPELAPPAPVGEGVPANPVTSTYTEPIRKDGCVGPAATCGYYDKDGNPIWVDKQTGRTSPRYYDENGKPTMDPQ